MKLSLLMLLCASLALAVLAIRPAALAGTNLQPADSQTTTEDATAENLIRLRGQYDTSLKALIDSRCQICHSGRALSFSDFDLVKKNSEVMADAVSNGSMPLGAPLTADERILSVNFLTELASVR